MTKYPIAAACASILIAVTGGLAVPGDADAAVYRGIFDPRGDVYGFEGTHSFDVDDACLETSGWKTANGNSGYDAYDGFYESCGDVVLTDGSLTLRKYASDAKDSEGEYIDNTVVLEQTFPFSTATDGLPMSQYILGIYVAFDEGTGRNELAGVDTPALYGTFGPFDGLHWALEWVSGFLPDGFYSGEGDGLVIEATKVDHDPVFLWVAACGGFECELDRAAVPGAVPTFVRDVPEPGSLGLVAGALAGLWWARRRRNGV